MSATMNYILCVAVICLGIILIMPFSSDASNAGKDAVSVDAGSTWEVTKTTRLTNLTVGEGASITAPEGYSVTLTVDNVETGINPGVYKGNIVLTVTRANMVEYTNGGLTHFFRQGLYLDETGLVEDKSVLDAVVGGNVNDSHARDISITSIGENFNGIYVAGGTYTIENAKIKFTGNGGNDFAGYGAAVMATGEGTTLILDNAEIDTHGVVRTAVIAGGNSDTIIKNSSIRTRNGVLPDDYVPTVQLGEMKEVPWMLGLVGNCRATNLLGENTKATYINSSISAEGWGVLSTDDCQNVRLTAINSKISISGDSGYGAYAIGNAVESFYGCDINVADYAVINRGGKVVFGAATHEIINKLNKDLILGLSEKELSTLDEKQTTVTSGRFGVMWHGDGEVDVVDGTVFNCEETIFLVKGASANINVDGSRGARLNSGSSIIIQVMDDDDPGPVMIDGKMLNQGVYKEPAGPPEKAEDFDVTTVNDSDVIAVFSDITLKGDFYNAVTRGGGGMMGGPPPGGPGGPPPGGKGGPLPGGKGGPPPGGPGSPPGGGASGKNLVLDFRNSNVTGVISASSARHIKDTITSKDYQLLGKVSNTPKAAVNNGVIVSLTDSTWTVTNTSFLTSLTIDNGASIKAPMGSSVAMTVNGVDVSIAAGNYKGEIIIKVNK